MKPIMRHYAVFGNPVAHSLSPLMHNAAFGALGFRGGYESHLVDNLELSVRMIRERPLAGVSVTMPVKGAIMDFLDDLDEDARAIGAVAKKARDGKLVMDDLTGGTFTITNGGVFGSLVSTPIINFPQVGILGLHKVQDRAMVASLERHDTTHGTTLAQRYLTAEQTSVFGRYRALDVTAAATAAPPEAELLATLRADAKQQAGEVARTVDGVSSVDNDLEIRQKE